MGRRRDDDDDGLELAGVGASRVPDDIDAEYGEPTSPRPRPPSAGGARAAHRAALRRQNCLFGTAVLLVAGAFVAAYLRAGLSFSPARAGIYGDVSEGKDGE